MAQSYLLISNNYVRPFSRFFSRILKNTVSATLGVCIHFHRGIDKCSTDVEDDRYFFIVVYKYTVLCRLCPDGWVCALIICLKILLLYV